MLDFVVGITTLVAARQLRRLEAESDDERSVRLNLGWVLAGVVSSIGWLYAYDIDAVDLRGSRRRRLAITACWSGLANRALPDDVTTTYSLSIGTGIGTFCYRFWFGLVRPRPGSGRLNSNSNSNASGE